jgi:uncharacterized protein (DUF1501 family)
MISGPQLRRRLLQGLCAMPFAGMLASPRLLWAAQPSEQRLIVIILRGGLDGLTAVPAIGDPHFLSARGVLAQSAEGALKLNDFFGLDKRLGSVGELYQQKRALIFHAVALPYRERSHFDAQDVLEAGMPLPASRDSGWLNRALQAPGFSSQRPLGLALASAMPLTLRGPARVTSWMPSRLGPPAEDVVTRIAMMYEGDPLLEPIIRAATGNHSGREAEAAGPAPGSSRAPAIARQAARFLLDPDGPRAAVIDIGGFDSHAGQLVPNGLLNRALGELDATIRAFVESLAPVWPQTSILVVTEFGRTVALNGSAGTDHGTAAAAFLLGGSVNGGRVIADWPGLAPAQRHEGRDLKPTLDLRAVIKGVLVGEYRLDPQFVDRTVFPDSGAVGAVGDLYRS